MNTTGAPPARLMEMLSDGFGALEAVAYSSIKLSRYVSECEMLMDLLVTEAVLEFGEDLRNAEEAAGEWTEEVLGRGAVLTEPALRTPQMHKPSASYTREKMQNIRINVGLHMLIFVMSEDFT